jgi:hypothetical protein
MLAIPQLRQTLALVILMTGLLGGCGSSDVLSYEQDTFFEQAMPTWLIPKLRDDYMGKKYFQPNNVVKPVEHDETGNPVQSSSAWSWWPWSKSASGQ